MDDPVACVPFHLQRFLPEVRQVQEVKMTHTHRHRMHYAPRRSLRALRCMTPLFSTGVSSDEIEHVPFKPPS